MARVGIILINYKDYAEKYLAECQESLEDQSYPRENYKVYIVDNCSSEESFEYLQKSYPKSTILPRLDGNYAAGNNKGIKKAIEDGCELFVIANMDTKFDKNWLEELVKTINSDEKVGIAQSKILLYPRNEEEKQKPKINSLGNRIHYLGFGFTEGYGLAEKETEWKNSIYTIDGYASGCSLIIKKEVLDKIGFYNEDYYMYHDDLELGWRAKLAGYKTVLAEKSVVYHKYEFSRSIRMVYFMERNRYLTLFTFYKIPTIILLLPMIIILDLAMILYSILGKWFLIKMKVSWYFIKPSTWKRIMKIRREIKKFRKFKDKDILNIMSGQVKFQEINNVILQYLGNPIMNLYLLLVKKIVFW